MELGGIRTSGERRNKKTRVTKKERRRIIGKEMQHNESWTKFLNKNNSTNIEEKEKRIVKRRIVKKE